MLCEQTSIPIKELLNICISVNELANEISLYCSEQNHIIICDDKVKKILKKIQCEDFESIQFLKTCNEILSSKDESIVIYESLDDAIDNSFDDYDYIGEFISIYHPRNYKRNLTYIGSIITSKNFPPEVNRYFNEIKELFALGFELSCVALCRSLIELCLYDKLKSKGYFKEKKIISIDVAKDDKLHRLINDAKFEGIINTTVKDKANIIRLEANEVLHPRPNKKSDFNCDQLIHATMYIIEFLYK